MYHEADLLPISALQHLAFCKRQWALIHLEGMWAENRLTVEGRHLHDRAHEQESESRGELRIARGLRLHSLRLGLAGVADVVEFRLCSNSEPQGWSQAQLRPPTDSSKGQGTAPGVILPGLPGLWLPVPVEYKHGQPKHGPCDEVQLCAQALSLEEMLGVEIGAGALFYGKLRHRHQVAFTPELRRQTEKLSLRLHDLTRLRKTPPALYEKKCDSCSLFELCMPRVLGKPLDVEKYLSGLFTEPLGE